MAKDIVIEIDTSQLDIAKEKIETFLSLCRKSWFLMFIFGIKKESDEQ